MSASLADTKTKSQKTEFCSAIIRSETALSQYPIHWLEKVKNASKHQVTGIEVIEKNEQGEFYPAWKVTYNTGYGFAGILAYKIDTLVINRRIDEVRYPEVPALIKLGSLREIAREVDLDGHTAQVKKALYQNAFVAIVTKQAYTDREGTRHTFEFGDTRYGVFFLGQELPDGRKADAVYIFLHESYRALLNSARTRPLDYDYLKALAPGSQRFYELLSFQIFAALRYKRPRARLVYSEYCSHAPQTRYDQYKRMHRQMKDIQEPHLASGYIESVEYQVITDEEGNPDWEILYAPGHLAKQHYQAANASSKERVELGAKEAVKALPAPATPPDRRGPSRVPTYDEALVAELVSHGLTNDVAIQLATEKPEVCRNQLDLLSFQTITKNKAGFLRRAIESPGGYGIPAEYEKKRQDKARSTQQNATQGLQEARRAALAVQLVEMSETLLSDHAEALTGFLAFFKSERDRDLRKFPKEGRMHKAMAELYSGEQKQLELIVIYYANHSCPLAELGAFIQTYRPEPLKTLIRAYFEARAKSTNPA